MNTIQDPMINPRYKPQISPERTSENLFRLITPGVIRDKEMERRISRLEKRFREYASLYPFGLWAPGLAVTAPMRAVTELYLPITEIETAFDHLITLSLNYSPATRMTAIHTSATWLEALDRLQPHICRSNPAALLRRLMADENYRIEFLFALFLPKRHGGGFNRYPGQWKFLQSWLGERTKRKIPVILNCLDCACATGESTYELALTLMKNGLPPESFLVHGSTLELMELFSAAHVYFPHDPKRQASFRQKVKPVFDLGAEERIEFFTEDILNPNGEEKGKYDLILCNGLLGGPLFSNADRIAQAASRLRGMLRDRGTILVADRFHGGWKKLVPDSLLVKIFLKCGFRIQDLPDGFAARKN